MKTHEFEKSVFYRAACDCGDPDCDITLEIEKENNFPMVYLNLYKTLNLRTYYHKDNWFLDLGIFHFFRKMKILWRIFIDGHFKVEETFVMCEEQIDALIQAIEEGRTHIKENGSENR